MQIAIVYNRVTSRQFGQPEDILADEDSIKTVRAIRNALSGLGHKVEMLPLDETTIKRLKNSQADIFFNQAFGIGNLPKSETLAADALEKTGRPYTGSGAQALVLTTDKIATKQLLVKSGLPTPSFQFLVSPGERLSCQLRYPVIVKPSNEDASLGIDGQASVFKSQRGLTRRVNQILRQYVEPVLVEEYITGRELNATVIGNGSQAEVLPVSEIVFGPSFAGKYKVVDFAAKWREKSVAYRETVNACPAKMKKYLRKKIEEISLEAFRLTGCRDYARIDLRLDKSGRPWILEVNANPGIGPDDGATRSAKAAGYSYPWFLQKIIDVAMARYYLPV